MEVDSLEGTCEMDMWGLCLIDELGRVSFIAVHERVEGIKCLICLMLYQRLGSLLLAFMHNDTDVYVLDLLLRTNRVNMIERLYLQHCVLHLPS